MAGRVTPDRDPLPALGELGIPLLPFGPPAPVTLVGLTPAARAYVLLRLANRGAGALAVVVRTDSEAEALARDLRELARLTGLISPGAITLFPALDADPYDGLPTHLGVVCHRVRALWSIARGEARVAVVPGRALLVPLPPPVRLAPYFVPVREGLPLRQADDKAWFQEAGYRRVDLVTDPGEYSRRGGILDVYPPIGDEPLRIELDGETVVSLRRFDPSEQRSTGRIESAELSPARETVIGRPELDNLRAALRDNAAGRRMRERLETEGRVPGMAACARVLYPGAVGILEHLAAREGGPPLWIAADELEMSLQEIEQARADLGRMAASSGDEASALPPPDDLLEPADRIEGSLRRAPVRLRQLDIHDEEEAERAVVRFSASALPSYRGRLADLIRFVGGESAAGRTVCLAMKSDGRAGRMRALLVEAGLASAEPIGPEPADVTAAAMSRPARQTAPSAGEESVPGRILLATAEISGGFILPEAGLTLIAEREIFGDEPRHRKKGALPAFTSDFRDLDPGDLIVHVDHGVGRYEGLSRIAGEGQEVDVMVLSYLGRDKLFVPVTRLDLVQKYSGVGGRAPSLDKLGGTGWGRTKQRVRVAAQEMAAELLNLYAERRAIKGHAFAPDTSWQRDFELSFPYELTPDQQVAITDIKRDLESTTPMDRLLCGDVGFGKTEVAMRAAFKAVMEGKQVAVLAPTTVLVFQHLNTFRERFAAFPARIESLSRFKSPKGQKEIVTALAAGAVDVVIGTHRLLSQDVAFRDLGLLIVDEEQRFGVAHKERIKKLRRNVDVLTLTATPIPRTLQMSLMGVRDLSVIETPPENRLAIQTHLLPFKEPIIAAAIRQELAREGQVYFVHNRVESVYAMAGVLERLVPESRLCVAHGQMPERELEQAMLRFLRGEFQVLVSTTIIENGLDIPRVNTLIVNRADHFGLAQLYQLRGRIGRSDRQAYAYLLVPPERVLTELARKRLKVLQDFSELGSGFRIAAMDLEIRGAGNLLGHAQHGHIAEVGFDLYCRMLERAVQDLKEGGGEVAEFRAALNLGVDLRLPSAYIADEHHRLMFYKKIASAVSREDLERVREEMEDRYGRLPRQGINLLEVAGLRVLAERLRVQQLDYRTGQLIVKFSETSPVDPAHLMRFVGRRPEATFSPPALLRIRGERSESERLALAREVLTELG